MSDLVGHNISQILNGVKNNEFSIEEYVSQIISHIKKTDNKIKAFITTNFEDAAKKAILLDRRIKEGERVGRLAGIVVGVKDNISTKGIRTTCGSKMLSEYIPPYDATVIKKLKENDAIIIGKLNLDEFGMGSTTEFSYFGPTHNPWNLNYVVGGSSGGSAAAVASQQCTISLGSDTGGSIRCPSSFCSVVGFKPTYGSISRFGLISYANSLEQIGPIARSVEDIETILNIISGKDPCDDTTIEDKPIRENKKDQVGSKNNNNIKIGLVKELINGADKEVSDCIYNSMDKFNELGFVCEETSMESTKYALASYYTIASAEASSNLARYDNVRYGYSSNPEEYEWSTYFSESRKNFGDEVKRRIIIGSYVLSSGYFGKYYLKAQKVRTLLKKEIKSLFKKYDFLISPTVPVLPFKNGEKIDDPIKMYLIDIDTVIANLTNIPAVSLPAGFSNNGLPIGLQIMGNVLHDDRVLQVARLFENIINIKQTPTL